MHCSEASEEKTMPAQGQVKVFNKFPPVIQLINCNKQPYLNSSPIQSLFFKQHL